MMIPMDGKDVRRCETRVSASPSGSMASSTRMSGVAVSSRRSSSAREPAVKMALSTPRPWMYSAMVSRQSPWSSTMMIVTATPAPAVSRDALHGQTRYPLLSYEASYRGRSQGWLGLVASASPAPAENITNAIAAPQRGSRIPSGRGRIMGWSKNEQPGPHRPNGHQPCVRRRFIHRNCG
ncbi:hypothetical protein FQZ97_694480 [compost metagenome]